MRCLIIDDEQHCITTLAWSLQEYCQDIEVIGFAFDGNKGIEAIEKYKPDFIFLDIEMPNLNGIDMLEKIEKIDFKVIFTTAYYEYALKAIKLSAVDYLLKPIDKDELIEAVSKLKQNSEQEAPNEKISTFKHNLVNLGNQQKIVITTLDGMLFYDVDTIVSLEAQSNYTVFYFSNKTKVIASKTLRDFEEVLPNQYFFRCHNSFIINLKYITKYQKGDGGTVFMVNGQEIEISRRKKQEFLEKLLNN